MRLSAFRFLYLLLGEVSVADSKKQAPPLLFCSALFFAVQSWRCFAKLGRGCVARTTSHFVIAGLDPAIHAEPRLVQSFRKITLAAPQHGPPGQARW